jgi:hypothetical protein
MEILQMPKQKRIVMIYEGGAHIWRNIYMDGRPHPPAETLNADMARSFRGSLGRRDARHRCRGFNEGSWIDMGGKPHTSKLHIVERFTRTDLYTLHYEATIDDPGAYTAPWKLAFDVIVGSGGEIQEYICQENNRWGSRLAGDPASLPILK